MKKMTAPKWSTMLAKAHGCLWCAAYISSPIHAHPIQVDDELVRQQQAAYSISGVDEEASRVTSQFVG